MPRVTTTTAMVNRINPSKWLFIARCSRAVVTDSGGFQKEAYFAEKRALVMMPDTGWRELVEVGWHRLCAPDAQEMTRAFADLDAPGPCPAGIYGDGAAGDRVAQDLAGLLASGAKH